MGISDSPFDLYEAIKNGDKKKVLNLLAKGLDPDLDIMLTNSAKKPLYIAAKYNQTEIAKALLAFRKVDINYKNGPCEETALDQAMQNLNLDLIELFLNVKDININGKSMIKYGPGGTAFNHLFFFYRNRINNNPHPEMVKSLDEKRFTKAVELFLSIPNLDVDPQDSLDHIRLAYNLYCLVRDQYIEVVNLLINDERINPNILNDSRWPILEIAFENKDQAMLDCLMKSDKINCELKNYKGLPILHQAVHNSDLEMTKFLLTYERINPNILNDNGDSILHVAFKNKDQAMLDCLIKSNKVNCDIKNSKGMSILHQAVQNSDLEMTQFLLKYDIININALTNTGKTLMDLGIDTGNKDIIELLTSKVDLNTQDSDGNTALHKAILSGRLDIIKLVNTHKPDLSIKNNNKLTPTELAKIEWSNNTAFKEWSNNTAFKEYQVNLVGENNDNDNDIIVHKFYSEFFY